MMVSDKPILSDNISGCGHSGKSKRLLDNAGRDSSAKFQLEISGEKTPFIWEFVMLFYDVSDPDCHMLIARSSYCIYYCSYQRGGYLRTLLIFSDPTTYYYEL